MSKKRNTINCSVNHAYLKKLCLTAYVITLDRIEYNCIKENSGNKTK